MDQATFEILEKLNSMYSSAFNQLVTYTVGLMAFVGLLVPVVVSWIQNRSFQREMDAIAERLQEEASKIREELKKSLREELVTELRTEIRNEIAAIERRFTDSLTAKEVELSRKIIGADAGVFHVQGMLNATGNHHGAAVISFCGAASHYLLADDERNLQRVLGSMTEHLKKVDLKQIDPAEVEEAIGSLTQSLTAKDINGRYTDTIKRIERTLADARTREPKKQGGN